LCIAATTTVNTFAPEMREAIEAWGEHVASLVRTVAPREGHAMLEKA
jgi:hypothetical protein